MLNKSTQLSLTVQTTCKLAQWQNCSSANLLNNGEYVCWMLASVQLCIPVCNNRRLYDASYNVYIYTCQTANLRFSASLEAGPNKAHMCNFNCSAQCNRYTGRTSACTLHVNTHAVKHPGKLISQRHWWPHAARWRHGQNLHTAADSRRTPYLLLSYHPAMTKSDPGCQQ